MGKVYFITGADTGIGKTIATGMMARHLVQKKVRTATVKMIQTGNHGFSEDLELHRKIMGLEALPEDAIGDTAPQIFDFPSSPHLAAQLENRVVDSEKIAEAVNRVAEKYEVTLVEGAGGLMVPLTLDLLTIDFAARQNWEFILVVSGKLGGLNHALLSLEAIARRNIPFAGVVYNYCEQADPIIDQDSPAVIQRYLKHYGLPNRMVKLGKVDLDNLHDVDFSSLFQEA